MKHEHTPSLFIRPATHDDVPLILSLIRELADYEKAPQDAKATAADLDRNLFGEGYGRGPTAECLIGLIDGVPQGFALFFSNFSTWVGRSGIYLEDLFVRPAARGSGLGKALLHEIAKIAVARNCGRMEWSVLDWNTPAIGFYKSLGAVAMDEWTVYRMTEGAIRKLASV